MEGMSRQAVLRSRVECWQAKREANRRPSALTKNQPATQIPELQTKPVAQSVFEVQPLGPPDTQASETHIWPDEQSVFETQATPNALIVDTRPARDAYREGWANIAFAQVGFGATH
jgi:hypothetical protein